MEQLAECPISFSLDQFNESLCEVTSYVVPSNNNHLKWKNVLANIYDHLAAVVSNKPSLKKQILLPRLYIDNFDDEQVWQQIELLNNVLLKEISSEIHKKLADNKTKPKSEKKNKDEKNDPDPPLNNTSEENKDDAGLDADNIDCDDDGNIDADSIDYDDGGNTDAEKPEFFRESDMLKFCEEMEKETEINSDDAEEEEMNIFGNDEYEEKEDEEESRLEKELRKVRKQIAENEEEAMQEKPWHMLGESSQKDREKNALLEENLQFEHGVRPAPEITLETTSKIERLILDRIRSKLFDDVERKVKPIGRDRMKQHELALNQEKSKLSLAEVYEKDYVEAQEKAAGVKKEKIDENEEKIKIDLQELFKKLDALSNFSFTPKTVKEELKVVVNAPAISMEEAMPTAVADTQILAPGEVKAKQKEELRTSLEETSTDRKRKRRKIKKGKSIKSKERESKKLKRDRDGTHKVRTKSDAINVIQEEVKQGITLAKKSSNKVGANFFSQLQDSVNAEKAGTGKKYKKKHTKKFSKF